MAVEVFQADHDPYGIRIAIVQARFNEPVGDALRAGCLAELSKLGVAENDIFTIYVQSF